MQLRKKWFSFYTTNGGGWVRVFKFGFGWKDVRKHGLTFSERNGYRRHFMIGYWSIGLLRLSKLDNDFRELKA